jgi:hypothetical protein
MFQRAAGKATYRKTISIVLRLEYREDDCAAAHRRQRD